MVCEQQAIGEELYEEYTQLHQQPQTDQPETCRAYAPCLMMTNKSKTMTQNMNNTIIHKINALLNKTVENGCTEAEAVMALEKAKNLMLEYEIKQGDLALKKEQCRTLTLAYKKYLLPVYNSLKKLLGCRIWTNKKNLLVFGLPKDIDIFAYMLSVVETAVASEEKTYRHSDTYRHLREHHHGRTIMTSFRQGMCRRIGDRLNEMRRQSDIERRQTQTRTSLVATKNAIIERQFAEMGLRLSSRTEKIRPRSSSAYQCGRNAGGKVTFRHGVRQGSTQRLLS